MQNWTGIGNLANEPQMIEVGNNKQLCKMVIAINETYTKADGTRPVDYFTLIAWGNVAERCSKYLHKGDKVAVMGALQNRQYETSEGEKRYQTEIVVHEVEFLQKKA